MRNRYIFSLFLLVNLHSTRVARGEDQPLNLTGKAVIHISQTNVSATIPLTAYLFQTFPAFDGAKISDSLSLTRRQVWLSCPVKTVQQGHLFIKDDKLKVLLIPGDTVHLQIQSSGSSDSGFSYSFSGKTKQQQTYYLSKKQAFPVDPDQAGINAGMDAKNLVVFQRYLDSLTNVETHFWQRYQTQHTLPPWFVTFESNAIRYADARSRLYMTWYQINFQQKQQRIPADYYRFLDALPLVNKQAQYQIDYLNFLHEYLAWQLTVKGRPIQSTPPATYYPALYALAKQVLGPDLGAFFELWTISGQAKDNPERTRTQLATYQPTIQYSYLLRYLINRAGQKQLILQPGDKAPSFYLIDTQDSLVSLSQFRGQVVYLCFWFATCGGCKVEFPFENQLANEFNQDSVKIISICTHTAPDAWRSTSQQFDLKTINLYANKNWEKKLESAYAINAYPHYVLIDAEGRIVENFTTRPSQNAKAKIRQTLRTSNSK